MTRILHLIPTAMDFQSERALAMLVRGLGGEFEQTVETIGPGGTWRGAVAAVRGLRARNDFDGVHAWGTSAMTVAALGTKWPITYSPIGFPSEREIKWVKAVSHYRRVEVICTTNTMLRAFVKRGIAQERLHLVRVGVEFALINRRRDAKLREQLGFDADDFVMLAVGESQRSSEHELAVWTTGVLNRMDPKTKLLLWGRGSGMARILSFATRTREIEVIRVAENALGRKVEFEDLMPATDAALVTASAPVPTLPIAIVMAAGLPIVARVTPTVSELLEDRHTALMVGEATPRTLAQRVLDLRGDSQLQWTIADRARTEAYEFYSLNGFLQGWREVYGRVGDSARGAAKPQAMK